MSRAVMLGFRFSPRSRRTGRWCPFRKNNIRLRRACALERKAACRWDDDTAAASGVQYPASSPRTKSLQTYLANVCSSITSLALLPSSGIWMLIREAGPSARLDRLLRLGSDSDRRGFRVGAAMPRSSTAFGTILALMVRDEDRGRRQTAVLDRK